MISAFMIHLAMSVSTMCTIFTISPLEILAECVHLSFTAHFAIEKIWTTKANFLGYQVVT